MKFTNAAAAFTVLFFGSAVLASPSIKLHPRSGNSQQDVYAPPIMLPNEGDEWCVGKTYKVTWDVSDPPKQITNKIGRVMLRKGDFTTPLVLADGFNITDGEVDVVCPWVVEGADYRVVLFGDSGNWSNQFTIVGRPSLSST